MKNFIKKLNFSPFNLFLIILLLGAISFSVIKVVFASTTPAPTFKNNPGHSWAEVSDGTFQVTGPSVLRNYTFPDSDAYVLTTPTASGTSGYVLTSTGAGTQAWSPSTTGNIVGTGATNYVTKWTTGGSVLGASSIFDNGNVGIGTATPSDVVEIYSATDQKGLRITNNTQSPRLDLYSNNIQSGNRNWGFVSNNWVFGTLSLVKSTTAGGAPNTNVMSFDNAGNVGIGNTAPGAKLEVTGNIKAYTGGATGWVDMQPGNASSAGYVEWYRPDSTTRIGYIGYSTGGANNLGLNLENSASFNINGGNVGIGTGTAAPSEKLSIVGAANTNVVSLNNQLNNIAGVDYSEYQGISFNGDTATGYNRAAIREYANNVATRNSALAFWTEQHGVGFAERMRILGNGNVGIGITTPLSKISAVNNSFDATTNPGYKFYGYQSSSSAAVPLFHIQTGWESNVTANVFKVNTYQGEAGFNILANGNVGVGTVAPTNTKLSIIESAAAAYGLNITNRNSLRTWGLAVDSMAVDDGKFTIADVTSGSQRLVIDTTGNVGIGTTAPATPLHVLKTTDGTVLTVENTTATFSGIAQKINTTRAATSGYYFLEANANGVEQFRLQGDGTTVQTGSNIFYGSLMPNNTAGTLGQVLTSGGPGAVPTWSAAALTGTGTLNYIPKWTPSGTALGNSMVYDSGTGVGIGTTGPGSLLHIAGATGAALNVSLEPNGWSGLKHRLGVQYSGDTLVLSTNALLTSATAGNLDNTSDGAAALIMGQGTFNIVRASAGANARTFSSTIYGDTTGNVGIGTVAPGGKLEVAGSSSGTSQAMLLLHDNAGNANSRTWGIENAVGGSAYGTLGFHVGTVADGAPSSTPSMVIDKNGNVGIGTTSLSRELNVNSTGNGGIRTSSQGSTYYFETVARGGAGTIDWDINIGDDTHGIKTPMSFQAATGNVGIGTTGPNAKLDVAGSLIAGATGKFYVAETAASGELPAGAYASGNAENLSFIVNGGTSGKKVGADYYNQSAWYSAWEVANPASGYSNLLLMKSGGNVGIGTTSPGAKLDVTGNVFAGSGSSATQGLYLGPTGFQASLLYNTNGNLDITPRSGYSSIFTAGNVGIGTTGPDQKLHVYGGTDNTQFKITRGGVPGQYLTLGVSGADSLLNVANTTTAAYPQFALTTTNNASTLTRLFVDQSGNVGIGSVAPGQKFDAIGYAILGDVAQATRTADAAANYGLTIDQTGPNMLRLVHSAVGKVDLQINGTAGTRRLDFVDTDNSALVPLTVKLDGTGNVGIGTTNPLAKFQVGAVTFTTETVGVVPSARIFGAPAGSTTNDPNHITDSTVLRLIRDTNNGISYGAGADFRLGTYLVPNAGDGYLPHTRLTFALKSTALVAETANVDVMSLLDTGKVGIGTTNPGYPLEVAGTIFSSAGGFRFPDNTTQTTAATSIPYPGAGIANSTGSAWGASYAAAMTATVSTLAQRDSAGDITSRLFRSEYPADTGTTGNYFMQMNATGAGADNYARPLSNSAARTALGLPTSGTIASLYLPLTAGIASPLTGDLYVGGTGGTNDLYARLLKSAGTTRGIISLTSNANNPASIFLDGNAQTNITTNTTGAIYNSFINGSSLETLPTGTTLGTMSGFGYGYSTAANTIASTSGGTLADWGFYVAGAGLPKIFLDAISGDISNSSKIVNGQTISNAAVFSGTLTTGGLINATNYLQVNSKYVVDGTDTYLRLNQQNSFSAGVYTPYNLRVDGTTYIGGTTYYLNSGTSYLNTLSVAGQVTVAGSTSNSSIKAGSVEIQGYALNNDWIADNLYFDGGNWRYRVAGTAEQMYFNTTGIHLILAGAGSAGAIATMANVMDVTSAGVTVTGTATATSFTGSGAGLTGTALSLNVGGTAGSTGILTGSAHTNGSDGWFRSDGAAGWYNQTYAVGIYATETGNVRTYNGANFIAAGTVTGSNLSGTNTGDNAPNSNYLPLAGGTLTGALYGTTGNFSSLTVGASGITASLIGVITPATNTGTGALYFQAGAAALNYGGGLILYSHANSTNPGWVKVGISYGSGGKFAVNTQGQGAGTDVFTVDSSGNTVVNGTLTSGLINGQTISSVANFTGTMAVASTISASSSLTINSGNTLAAVNILGTSADLGLSINNSSTGGRSYSLASTGATSALGAGSFRIYDATSAADRLVIGTAGGIAIGSYAGANVPPANGLIISGNVGIGNPAPVAKLHITAGNATAIMMTYDTNNTHRNYISNNWVTGNGASSNMSFAVYNGTANTSITALTLKGTGDATLAGCLVYNVGTLGSCVSDMRLKKNINDFNLGLKDIVGLKPVTYQYNGLGGTTADGRIRTGLIAQQVLSVSPGFVSTVDEKLNPTDVATQKFFQVDYNALTFALINAVKELNIRVISEVSSISDKLVAIVNRLDGHDKRITQLEKDNTALKTLVCIDHPTAVICQK